MSNFYKSFYENDGSGRDTFVNHAGAYWMNPLPTGVFYKSRPAAGCPNPSTENGTSLLMEDNIPHLGQTLIGKSRYGTTLLAADQAGLLGTTVGSQASDAVTGMDAMSADATARKGAADTNATGAGNTMGMSAATGTASSGPRTTWADGEPFDGENTALKNAILDVSQPERRLRQPGHSTVGLEGTDGGSTFNGIKDPWTAPKAVDNTLLRLAPGYESTCHYHLRTGRFYTEDIAPPHEMTLPDKGVTWGKSRYY